jgi:hypothetical protein
MKMPGTVALMNRDVECHLLRTFVLLKPMVLTAFQSCSPVLSLDASCHMMNSFKGVLMSATMIDGERQTQELLA